MSLVGRLKKGGGGGGKAKLYCEAEQYKTTTTHNHISVYCKHPSNSTIG